MGIWVVSKGYGKIREDKPCQKGFLKKVLVWEPQKGSSLSTRTNRNNTDLRLEKLKPSIKLIPWMVGWSVIYLLKPSALRNRSR